MKQLKEALKIEITQKMPQIAVIGYLRHFLFLISFEIIVGYFLKIITDTNTRNVGS